MLRHGPVIGERDHHAGLRRFFLSKYPSLSGSHLNLGLMMCLDNARFCRLLCGGHRGLQLNRMRRRGLGKVGR